MSLNSCPPELPEYPQPPAYTRLVGPGEQVLPTLSRLALVRSSRESHRVRITNGVVELDCIVNRDAEMLPIYRRGGVVDGTVTFNDIRRLTSVQVAVEGRLKASWGDSAPLPTFVFLSAQYTLWDDQTESNAPLPGMLRFAIPLPNTFNDAGALRALPPSFSFSSGDGFHAAVEYRVLVNATYRNVLLRGVTRRERSTVPVLYMPQFRPPRAPLAIDGTFLATLKAAPEEWETVSLGAHDIGLRCEFAYPAARVFTTGQVVPVHVQISGLTSLLVPGGSSANQQHILSASRLSLRHSIFNPSPSPSTTHDFLATRQTMSSLSLPSLGSSFTSLSTTPLSGSLKIPVDMISVRLERRIVLVGPLGPARRTLILSTATLHPVAAQDDGTWIALDGFLAVPADSRYAIGPHMQVGSLTVTDSLVVSVGKETPHEKRVHVAIVSETFFGDEDVDFDR